MTLIEQTAAAFNTVGIKPMVAVIGETIDRALMKLGTDGFLRVLGGAEFLAEEQPASESEGQIEVNELTLAVFAKDTSALQELRDTLKEIYATVAGFLGKPNGFPITYGAKVFHRFEPLNHRIPLTTGTFEGENQDFCVAETQVIIGLKLV